MAPAKSLWLPSKGPLKNYLHGATLGNKHPSLTERRAKRGEIHLRLHGADLIRVWVGVPAARGFWLGSRGGRDRCCLLHCEFVRN